MDTIDNREIADAIKKLIMSGKEVDYEEVIRDPYALVESADAINETVTEEPRGRDELIADAIQTLKIAGVLSETSVATKLDAQEAAINKLVDTVVDGTSGILEDESKFIEEIDNTVTEKFAKDWDRNMARESLKSKQQAEEELDKELALLAGQLNQTEVIFARSYARHKNLAQAAREAGSTNKRLDVAGHQIMKNPKVGEYFTLLCQKMSTIAALEATEVIGHFRMIYDKAMLAENFKEANIAARNLAEICGAIGGKTSKSVEPGMKKIAKQQEEAQKEETNKKKELDKLLDSIG